MSTNADKCAFLAKLCDEFKAFALELTREMGDEASEDHLQQFLGAAEAFVEITREDAE